MQVLIEQLKTCCNCEICTNQLAFISRHHSCNVAILLFLRYLGDIKTHIDSDLSIILTRSGLETAYNWQRTHLEFAQNVRRPQGGSYLGMIMGIPHASESLEDIKRFHPRSKPFLLDYILDGVSRLFIGGGHHLEFGERPIYSVQP